MQTKTVLVLGIAICFGGASCALAEQRQDSEVVDLQQYDAVPTLAGLQAGKQIVSSARYEREMLLPGEPAEQLAGTSVMNGVSKEVWVSYPTKQVEGIGDSVPYQVQRVSVFDYSDGTADIMVEQVFGPVSSFKEADGTRVPDPASSPSPLVYMYRLHGEEVEAVSLTENTDIGPSSSSATKLRRSFDPTALEARFSEAAQSTPETVVMTQTPDLQHTNYEKLNNGTGVLLSIEQDGAARKYTHTRMRNGAVYEREIWRVLPAVE